MTNETWISIELFIAALVLNTYSKLNDDPHD